MKLRMFSLIIIARIKVYSYESLPLENVLTLHNVIILIKSVLNKNQNTTNVHINKLKNIDKRFLIV